jgi:hypothetical protein
MISAFNIRADRRSARPLLPTIGPLAAHQFAVPPQDRLGRGGGQGARLGHQHRQPQLLPTRAPRWPPLGALQDGQVTAEQMAQVFLTLSVQVLTALLVLAGLIWGDQFPGGIRTLSLALAVLVIGYLGGQWEYSRDLETRRRITEARMDAWHTAMDAWERECYCQRCDRLFTPEE